MTTQPTTDLFCSLEALNTAETLYGTASGNTTIWFLLEYTEPWTAKAVTDNNLPPHVQRWFDGYLEEVPQSRLLFIKQDTKQVARPTRRFYLAITRENDQRLYSFSIKAYEELLWIDLEGILAGDEGYDQYLTDQQLYLVCTNGKRDRCCAKFGLELYQAMRAENDILVWQVTHIGGHRYAPTFAVFPQGIYYGLVQPADAAETMQTIAQNQIVLDYYRGRTCYPEVAQAADYYLRRQTGLLALNAFTLETAETSDQTNWTFIFRERVTDQQHQLQVELTFSEPVLASCSKIKYKPRPLYQLLSYQQL